MEVNEGVDEVWDASADVEEEDQLIIEVEVEEIWHIERELPTAPICTLALRILLDDWESLYHKDEGEDVLTDVEKVVRSHAEVVNEVDLVL